MRKGRGMKPRWSEACGCAGAQRGAPLGRSVGLCRAQRRIAQGAQYGAALGCGMRLRWGTACSWAEALRGSA